MVLVDRGEFPLGVRESHPAEVSLEVNEGPLPPPRLLVDVGLVGEAVQFLVTLWKARRRGKAGVRLQRCSSNFSYFSFFFSVFCQNASKCFCLDFTRCVEIHYKGSQAHSENMEKVCEQQLKSCHIFWIEFRYRLWLGHLHTCVCFDLNQGTVASGSKRLFGPSTTIINN